MVRGTPAPATGLSLRQLSSSDLDDGTEVSAGFIEALSPASLAENDEEPSFLPGVRLAHQQPPSSPAEYNPAQSSAPITGGGMTIVRNIASFLSLSDAESIASLDFAVLSSSEEPSSWSLEENQGMGQPSISWSSLGTTPTTPGLMTLSPSIGELCEEERYSDKDCPELVDLDDDDEADRKRRLILQQKKWIQQKLTAFVFAHPDSIRSYCLDAHDAALRIQQRRKEKHERHEHPETFREPSCGTPGRQQHASEDSLRRMRRRQKEKKQRLRIVKMLIDTVLHNVPLSVMMDIVEAVMDTGLDTSFAVFRIQCASVNAVVSALSHVIRKIWETIINFNPFAIIEATISLQFNAVGKTSEVLVSGIQSVATGVGSASTAALQRMSRGGAGSASMSNILRSSSKGRLRRNRSSEFVLNKKVSTKVAFCLMQAGCIIFS